MQRFVLSTIGTSLLTSQITHQERGLGWYERLRDTANMKAEELPADVQAILETLSERALEVLLRNDAAKNRRISAELNGVYGIYDNNLSQASRDIHYLIATDTAQGRRTAELVQGFLADHQIKAQVYVPRNLSTQDTGKFSEGIKQLVTWCDETIPGYRDSGYVVLFNLVGSFKSLQGYMNTIGMFYADEIVYIFEAVTADLIRIPRLPIQVDTTVVEAHAVKFALMAAGRLYSIETVREIPESLLDSDDEHATLSNWGLLIWNRAKSEILRAKLLDFPRLEYAPSFEQDFNRRGASERISLQETLAWASVLLEEGNGDTALLKADKSLQYENFISPKGLAKFRASYKMRISCQAVAGGLMLRCYDIEPEINAHP